MKQRWEITPALRAAATRFLSALLLGAHSVSARSFELSAGWDRRWEERRKWREFKRDFAVAADEVHRAVPSGWRPAVNKRAAEAVERFIRRRGNHPILPA